NDDGIKGGSEIGFSGATITLTGTDDKGNGVLAVTTTGPTGLYTFGNLRPGTYTVTETQPNGLLDGKDTAGTPFVVGTPANDQFGSVTVTPGVNGTGYNFGERPNVNPEVFGSISGFVYVDVNHDSIRELGEPGIGGVIIRLVGVSNAGPIDLTTTTNASG